MTADARLLSALGRWLERLEQGGEHARVCGGRRRRRRCQDDRPLSYGPLSSDRRSYSDRGRAQRSAAPGLTPDGEGGGDGEGGTSPRPESLGRGWRPRVRPAQRASCGETMTNGGMD